MTEPVGSQGPRQWVVRTPHGWWDASLPGDTPKVLEPSALVEDLLSSTVSSASGVVSTGPAFVDSPPTLVGGDLVEAVPTVVLRVAPPYLLFDGPTGASVLFGPEALTALAAMDGPIRVDALVAATVAGHPTAIAPATVEATVQRLFAARIVRMVVAAEPAEPAAMPVSQRAVEPTAEQPAPVPADVRVARWEHVTQRVRYAWRHSSKLNVLRSRFGSGQEATSRESPEDLRSAEPEGGTHVGVLPRIPVYALWPDEHGPPLSLGMVLAVLRAHDGGRLNRRFDFRRLERAPEITAAIAGTTGPAVLLCTDYLWSMDENLTVASACKAANPDLLVIHGGLNVPGLDDELPAFLVDHEDAVDLVVHGEGEETAVEIFDLLAEAFPPPPDRLGAVAGVSFLDGETGSVVRAPARARAADLDAFPSPYLTGEFDHVDPVWFQAGLIIETNRGCPYGCTFCDWGSATMSRVRKFDLDRVRAELRWTAEHGHGDLFIADANFGIYRRDVEIAEHLAALRAETGLPINVSVTLAKNTTKHFTAIMDVLLDAGIAVSTSLAVQTRDETILELVDRSNISTQRYLDVARRLRQRGLTLYGDLLIGLPGQTIDTYKADLQFMLEHEIIARSWPTLVLPNSPMNRPEYRARFGIELNEQRVMVASSSFTQSDWHHMLRLRFANTVFEQYGLLRHVARYLQWDHGVMVLDLFDRILDVVERRPDEYPSVAWVLHYFDVFIVPPAGWRAFFEDIRRFVLTELHIEPSAAFDAVLAVQEFLLPQWGRTFPASITRAPDYLAYYLNATASLDLDGVAGKPERPLAEYGPATFEVTGDPMGLCREGSPVCPDVRDPSFSRSFYYGAVYELQSPLLRNLPELTRRGVRITRAGADASAQREFVSAPELGTDVAVAISGARAL